MEHREEGVVCGGGMFFSNLSRQLSLSTGADPSFNEEERHNPVEFGEIILANFDPLVEIT